ncbi:hypothetical protein KC678_04970, partial [Candidatus Dojkabacteria bacterium]|nr:hypothetical protein [Candidatus Dojkabacteria bacterium]
MYTVTKYNNIKSSEVEAKIGIDEVFKIIKEGDSKLEFIKLARNYEKGSENYDSIKTSIIPTFRFNFLFEGKASNKNITEATGLIFIDIDNLDELPDSDFIYAKWKSISLTGYGVLVKVDGLTQNNFNNIYDEISKLLGVSSDSGARKPTQQTVQSFDPDIYINHDSRVYNCANSKKVPFPIKQKKEKGGLTTNDTFLLVPHINTNVRFNNIDNYFKDNDLHYLVFKE